MKTIKYFITALSIGTIINSCSSDLNTLPNGDIVDEITTPNKEISLSGNVLGAIKEGFMLLSLGGSAEFIAPSPMGYGKKGNDDVSPYQPIAISMRLDSIK